MVCQKSTCNCLIFSLKKATVCNPISNCQQFNEMRDRAMKWLGYENGMLLTKIPLLCSLERNTIISPHVIGTPISKPQSCHNNNQDIIFLTPLEGEEEGRV